MANPQRKNFEQLANAVRYYRWFADTVKPWVGSAILDVGCGHGNVIWNFLDAERVVGIDIESEYVAHVARRFAGFPNFHAEVRDGIRTIQPTGTIDTSAKAETKITHKDEAILAQSAGAGRIRTQAQKDGSEPEFLLRQTKLKGEKYRDGATEPRFMDSYNLGIDHGRFNISINVGNGTVDTAEGTTIVATTMSGMIRHDLSIPLVDYVIYVGDQEAGGRA